MGEYLLGRSFHDHFSLIQHDHLVCIFRDLLHLVLYQHDGLAHALHQLDDLEYIVGTLGIQLRGRLIDHQHVLIHDQDGCQRDPLLLPAGQLIRISVPEFLDLGQLHDLLDPLPDLIRLHAHIFQAVRQLLIHGAGDPADLSKWILEYKSDLQGVPTVFIFFYISSVDQHLPGDLPLVELRDKSTDSVAKRGLSTSVGAYQGAQLSFLHRHRHVMQHVIFGGWIPVC